jgi:hypothetical protein
MGSGTGVDRWDEQSAAAMRFSVGGRVRAEQCG